MNNSLEQPHAFKAIDSISTGGSDVDNLAKAVYVDNRDLSEIARFDDASTEVKRQLLQRIAYLEGRVTELERRLGPPWTPEFPEADKRNRGK